MLIRDCLKKRKTQWLLFLFSLSMWLFSVITYDSSAEEAVTSEKIPEILQALTPKGWEIYDRVKQFTPKNIYEQINGRAEFFLAYNMIEMNFVSFIKKNHEDQFIDLSVYNMGNALNAFGVFSAERSPGEKPVDLGRAAYHSDAHYYVWIGQFYIRIIASDSSELLRQTGLELARKLTDLIPESGKPVWGLNLMPKTDLVPGSLMYFRVDAMGLDFLDNVFLAQYRKGNLLFKMFLSRQINAPSVDSMIKQYRGYAKKYGEGLENVNYKGVNLISCDMGSNYDIIFQKGRLMGGIISVKEQEFALRMAFEFWKQLPKE